MAKETRQTLYGFNDNIHQTNRGLETESINRLLKPIKQLMITLTDKIRQD